jgi:hypothetical protein
MGTMNWSVIGPAVFSLVGVGLGTMGSIFVQYIGTRTSKEQVRAERYGALRAERKEAIREFLEAAQQVEQIAERRFQHGERPADHLIHTHRMKYLRQCIGLVGTPHLQSATNEYARRLLAATYEDLPEGANFWKYIRELKDPFMDAARRELDIPDLNRPMLT